MYYFWFLTNDVNESLASFDISANNLWHVIAGVGTSLLEDVIVLANGSTVLSVGHFNGLGTVEVFGTNHFGNGMEK